MSTVVVVNCSVTLPWSAPLFPQILTGWLRFLIPLVSHLINSNSNRVVVVVRVAEQLLYADPAVGQALVQC